MKRSRGSFNKVASDQCIEQTINREQKCHGGIKGYSTSEGTVQRWVLTSHIVSECISQLNGESNHQKKSLPKDLGPSRKKFDVKLAKKAYDILSNWGNPFTKRDTLINICSGVEATPDIQCDILSAEMVGETGLKKFWDERILSKEVDFYAPIKRLKLKSFENLCVRKNIKLKEKSVVIAAERGIFGRLLTIARSQDGLSLKQILCYSLSPIPWALGHSDGSLVKTTKSKLLGKHN